MFYVMMSNKGGNKLVEVDYRPTLLEAEIVSETYRQKHKNKRFIVIDDKTKKDFWIKGSYCWRKKELSLGK